MLTAYHLKLLAFGLMIIDHTGRLFFPQAHFMVAMGRLSFPLFAYLAALGEQYSKNLNLYLLRLVLMGILTQPFYAQFVNLLFQRPAPLNMLFGLAMGVATLRLIRKSPKIGQKLAVILLSSGIAVLVNIEGGLTTMSTLVFLAAFRTSWKWWLSFTLFEMVKVWLLSYPAISLWRLFSPLILLGYNGKQGPKSRLFYWIYPLHFLVLIYIHRIT